MLRKLTMSVLIKFFWMCSGKSFLLNVLLNSTQGFSVGAVPDPETQGIWIRIVPKEQLQGADNSRIILMDTEGFYGEGATRSYDARIFAIATLVSSHLIYNTLRTIGKCFSSGPAIEF